MKPRRVRALAAGTGVALLLLAVLAASLLMQPQRLARLVLGSVGQGLGLEIAFEGEARYRLRGTPLVEVRGVTVRQPGRDAFLRAGRALVSLPWSTVRGRGEPLLLHRIELDAPVLDLPGLQAWLATRPPGSGRMPTLSDGIAVRDGRVVAEGWALDGLALDIPSLAEAGPLAASARGVLALAAPTRVHFDLRLAATRLASGAGASARGRVRIEGADWQLPAFVTASGPLRLDDGVLRISPLRFGSAGAYRGDGDPLPFALGAHGPLRLRDGTWTLVPAAFALRGQGLLPTLDASGRAALGPALLLGFEGAMPAWPAAWPALPPPLDTSTSPVAIGLDYAGASDLSGPMALRMRRDAAEAEATLRITGLLAWMDTAPGGTPLPPLRARASAPRIEVAGGVLEGVEIGIEPGESP